MFFAASIALSLASIASLSVNSAPLASRTIVKQFCTGPSGGGTCTPLAGGGTGCTNTPGIQSLILNLESDCAGFPAPDCQFIGFGPVQDLFSDDSQVIGALNIQSVQCSDTPGVVNGFTKGSAEDIAQEADDAAAGVLASE